MPHPEPGRCLVNLSCWCRMGRWVCERPWKALDFQLQKAEHVALKIYLLTKRASQQPLHLLSGDPSCYVCGRFQQTGPSGLIAESTVTATGVTLLPAAAEGKHLQEKGEPGIESQGHEGRSSLRCCEHFAPHHPVPGTVLRYGLCNSYLTERPS